MAFRRFRRLPPPQQIDCAPGAHPESTAIARAISGRRGPLTAYGCTLIRPSQAPPLAPPVNARGRDEAARGKTPAVSMDIGFGLVNADGANSLKCPENQCSGAVSVQSRMMGTRARPRDGSRAACILGSRTPSDELGGAGDSAFSSRGFPARGLTAGAAVSYIALTKGGSPMGVAGFVDFSAIAGTCGAVLLGLGCFRQRLGRLFDIVDGRKRDAGGVALRFGWFYVWGFVALGMVAIRTKERWLCFESHALALGLGSRLEARFLVNAATARWSPVGVERLRPGDHWE